MRVSLQSDSSIAGVSGRVGPKEHAFGCTQSFERWQAVLRAGCLPSPSAATQRLRSKLVTAVAVAIALSAQVSASIDGITGEAAVTAVESAPLAAPIYGLTLPEGYRQWEMVSVSYEEPFDEFRAILGNSMAMAAYREGRLPFPDGSVLVKLAWKRVPSPEFPGAFVPGAATTVQVMVKDSRKFPASGGWGFGRFIQGLPADAAQHRTCFACHDANVSGRDFVFTRFAP